MTIRPEDVRHVSRLAEIAVPEEEVESLVQQLDRIMGFVEELSRLPAGDEAPAFRTGPARARLRPDEPGSVPLEHPVADIAPAFRDHLFLVPRLGTMEDAE